MFVRNILILLAVVISISSLLLSCLEEQHILPNEQIDE